jgi:diguanylate cyclase (GGDEF)-like protein
MDRTEGNAPTRPTRARSLRREWTRAFAVMLVLLIIAGAGTFFGERRLVAEFRGTAVRLDRETAIQGDLRIAMVDHEGRAHTIVRTAGPVKDAAGFLDEQAAISRLYEEALRDYPAADARSLLRQSRDAWQTSLVNIGLWGNQVSTFVGPGNDDQQGKLAADSDVGREFLDQLEKPTIAALHAGLARGSEVERFVVTALGAVLALAFGATVYYRRKMVRDLLRPVDALHRGVAKLRSGYLDHHVEIARHDELGELADAFNAMADQLSESHRALTLRATRDTLTGLANRAALAEHLNVAFAQHGGRRQGRESVLFIDVDDFKYVNDSLGHDVGDELLVQLACRLQECVREGDLVARLGGDEFAIIVAESTGECAAVEIADRVLRAMAEPFVVQGARLAVAASIGIAERGPETANAEQLLTEADFAMYMAKGGGKGRYSIFDAHMHSEMVGRTALKNDLAHAVTAGQLRLDYQPVADLGTGQIIGVEALVRWQHPTLGLLPPLAFIGLAEQTGDIDALGSWVLETACRQVATWRETLPGYEDLWVAVNLSAVQLRNPKSLAALQAVLASPGIDPRAVVLEVTESALVTDVEGSLAALRALSALGVRIALDDFGTGFSSLSTLNRLPVDILKIDRSFVSGGDLTVEGTAMLEGIIGLGEKLSLQVIAEGIEDSDQVRILREAGCSQGQGFLLARPCAPSMAEALLKSGIALATPVPSSR